MANEPRPIRWIAEGRFESHGVVLGVRASTAALFEEARRRLPPDARSVDAPAERTYSLIATPERPDAVTLYQNDEEVRRRYARAHVLDVFEGEAKIFVAYHAPAHVFVHAGVVGWKGGAIVLPGRSHAGKSSLVDALVRRGATYLSDEYAVLDRAGVVHPYATPMSLRQTGEERRRVRFDDAPRAPLPVGAVVVTRFVAGATFAPRPIAPGTAMLALIDNAISAQRAPRPMMEAFGAALAGSPRLLEGDRGDAETASAALLDLLD